MLAFLAGFPPVTLTFVALITALGIVLHVIYNPRTVAMGPTLLTTIGIFATFLGIALGLYNFDAGSVQASVPALLEGLKTAFFASVFGVGFAITLKMREFVFGPGAAAHDTSADDVTVADLVTHLREIKDALVGTNDNSLTSQMKLARQETSERLAPLLDIKRGLLGTEDGSLLTQVRLLRQDSNDRLDALRAAMTEALRKLSEMGTQTLIEALRDVIRDFNQKITEQFGENFRQLNTAVGNLLVWQEQYRSIIEITVAKLDDLMRIVGNLTEDFSVFVGQSERFAGTAGRLGDLLGALEAGERRLKDECNALATLLVKASDSLPNVERRVEELSAQMARAVLENQRVVGNATVESSAAMREAVEVVRKEVATITSQLSALVIQNQEAVGTALSENATAIRVAIEASQRDMAATNVDFNRQIAELASKTKEQVATLDAALATELSKSLESLARQFTAISQRFAQDYGPLADKLRQIVELAKVRQ